MLKSNNSANSLFEQELKGNVNEQKVHFHSIVCKHVEHDNIFWFFLTNLRQTKHFLTFMLVIRDEKLKQKN